MASSIAVRTRSRVERARKRAASSRPSVRSRSCANASTRPGAVDRLREEIAGLGRGRRGPIRRSPRSRGQLHHQEKDTVGFELQARASIEAADRLPGSRSRSAIERRTRGRGAARAGGASGGGAGVDRPHRGGTARRRRPPEPRAAAAVRGARGDAGAGRRTAEAKAGHAALTERATALAADIRRLEEAGRDLERASRRGATSSACRDAARAAARGDRDRRGARSTPTSRRSTSSARTCATAEERCVRCGPRSSEHEARIKEARRALESVRAERRSSTWLARPPRPT